MPKKPLTLAFEKIRTDALATAKSRRFDLILMDIQMPEMDGIEVATALRDQERASGDHVPIIAMTAHAMIGDRERCLAAGMDRYIAKPIRIKELFDTIEDLFGVRTEPDEPR